MKKPERSNYTTLDFQQWEAAGSLVISPKFQRRGVWGRPAQSYLIDTLLLELPVPPIYLRVVQDKARGLVREVVDGQQRISAVLSFVKDKFALSKNIESDAIGKKFSDLNSDQQNKILQYSFICEVFYGVEDRDILRIFARLNTNSVKLNAQELRNGKYFGKFKGSTFSLATEHLEFWRNNRIFSEQSIARMHEVEFVSELIIAMIAGMQDKKSSIDSFYDKYDDIFQERVEIENRFRNIIDIINESVGESLASTEFRRVPLFYTLFIAIAHRMYGVPGVDLAGGGRGKLVNSERERLEAAILDLSNVISAAKEDEAALSSEGRLFFSACTRQTDNLRPRKIRLDALYLRSFA